MTVDYTFANFAISSIAGGAGGVGSSLNSTDTSVIVQTGDGSKFGAPSSSAPLFVLLGSVTGTHEICKVTGVSTDTLTIVRAQESTIASTWSIGTTIQAATTAGVLRHALFDDGGLITTDGVGNMTVNFINCGTNSGIQFPGAGGITSGYMLFYQPNNAYQINTPQGGSTALGMAFGTYTGSTQIWPFSIGGQFLGAGAWVDNSSNLNLSSPPVLRTGHQETGFCGTQGYSPGAASGIGSGINFKTVMTNAPSSVTLATGSSTNMSSKQVISIDKYGGFLNIVCAATGNAYYYGDYTTVGNCILAVDTAAGTFDHHCDGRHKDGSTCGNVRRGLSLAADIIVSTPLGSTNPGEYAMSVSACPVCGAQECLNSGLASTDAAGADTVGEPLSAASQAAFIRTIQQHRGLAMHA